MSDTNIVYAEEKFGIGANPDNLDPRDFPLDAIVGAAALSTVDWVKGGDIRNYFVGDIPIKNQFQSLSCVGQGWAYKFWCEMIADLMAKYTMNLTELRASHLAEVQEISAKAIYSAITLGYGKGAQIRDGALRGLAWGAVLEGIVPSHKPDGTTDETFMIDKSWDNPAIDALAHRLEGKDARVIKACDNMDLFAFAIQANLGLVGGVVGSNGHGWGYDENPTPPNPGDALWGHCLFFGAFGTDEKGRFIATPNSWGQYVSRPVGPWQPGCPPGYGWQKIRPNYFTANLMFNPWTYTDKVSEEKMPTQPTIEIVHPFSSSMYYGTRSSDITTLQQALVQMGYLGAQYVTGYYGDFTAAAILKFELANNVDNALVLQRLAGKTCGPKTIAALNKIAVFNS